jgi:hypothetical protein
VHEQPEPSVRVTIELEEVIASSERPEVPPREGLARVLERSSGQRGREERIGHLDAATSMQGGSRGNGAAEVTHDVGQRRAIERPGIARDAKCRHAAPEIAAERARHERLLRRENGADGDTFGDVRVRHRSDEVHDVRPRREALELVNGLWRDRAGPHSDGNALPSLGLEDHSNQGAPPGSGGATPSKTKRRSGTRFTSMASARRARKNGVARASARSMTCRFASGDATAKWTRAWR